MSCLRWDLDVLASSPDDDWHLLEGPAAGSERLLEPLVLAGRGTLVVWERLDRIVTSGFGEQDFLDLMDDVERHLAMVFHRFLDGMRDLRLSINDRAVGAWDPFLRDHPATWSSPVERICSPAGVVKVQCHVLPHKDHLTTQQEQSAAGTQGWTAQQGFYVYRNRRLLVAGSWLGLGTGRSWTKEEAHRLARIQLDIPNSADADWKIDIRKSTASPPVGLRRRLTHLAEETLRAGAQSVRTSRAAGYGKRHTGRGASWRAEHTESGNRYRIDHEHPAIRSVLDDAGDLSAHIKVMLRVIEETVPVQRIWLDTTEARETPRTNFAGEPVSEVRNVLVVMFRNLVPAQGHVAAARAGAAPSHRTFNNYPEIVETLPDDPHAGGEDGIPE